MFLTISMRSSWSYRDPVAALSAPAIAITLYAINISKPVKVLSNEMPDIFPLIVMYAIFYFCKLYQR